MPTVWMAAGFGLFQTETGHSGWQADTIPAMQFPAYIELLGFRIHPHPVFELAGYAASFAVYALVRKRFPRAVAGGNAPLWIAVGALAGALLGAKLLGFLEWMGNMPEYLPGGLPGDGGSSRGHEDHHLFSLLGGKTVVGGLLGGWAGVEIAKRLLGVKHSTGDVYVFPLIAGMAVGRVGCFLTGLEDMTHGVESGLPWAVDFGDGVPRHPCQVYDVVFLAAIGLGLAILWYRCGLAATSRDVTRRSRVATGNNCQTSGTWPNGMLFRLFFALYFGYRFGIEFLKPRYEQLGPLSAIQVASLAGCLLAAWLAWRMKTRGS